MASNYLICVHSSYDSNCVIYSIVHQIVTGLDEYTYQLYDIVLISSMIVFLIIDKFAITHKCHGDNWMYQHLPYQVIQNKKGCYIVVLWSCHILISVPRLSMTIKSAHDSHTKNATDIFTFIKGYIPWRSQGGHTPKGLHPRRPFYVNMWTADTGIHFVISMTFSYFWKQYNMKYVKMEDK